MPDKPRLSMYWASSCGGCEIALVNLHERILDVEAHFDFVFCPCLLDTKKADVEAMEDGSIAVTFFNGSIRTDENEEMAHLLRRKSQLLVAFGSCAMEGCIPGLGNLCAGSEHVKTAFCEGPSADNPGGVLPQTEIEVPEGTLTLPAYHDKLRPLNQVVEVDYSIPGCPPESHQIWAVVEHVIAGRPLPERGAVLGAGLTTVCEECELERRGTPLERLVRTWQIIPEPGWCLLEQGLPCMGVATRSGCGGLCTRVNMPCTGCYGAPAGVSDQGAAMISALGAMVASGAPEGVTEAQMQARIDALLEGYPDLAGTLYRYSLAGSILGEGAR